MRNPDEFLSSPSGRSWQKLGARRRAGAALPLFFIRSRSSVGVGEFQDLEILADWCRSCGLSVIQLLPLNDMGWNFRPYDAESSFALEPMHLSLHGALHVPHSVFYKDIEALRARFPLQGPYFDTGVKREKIELLKKMFLRREPGGESAFRVFSEENRYWLEDYALYKTVQEKMQGESWERWPEELRFRKPEALQKIRQEKAGDFLFHQWLQWQLFAQLGRSAESCRKKGVFILGDLPFLVARDSADVWSHPEYFKLDRLAGAPPDAYFADGQQWGMPPYHWPAMDASGYAYLKERLSAAGNFYDLFRIDHFVGIFRIWSFPLAGTRQGSFDPPDERLWEPQGRRILDEILKSTEMLPCAEDLGMVPECATRVLAEYGLPGMEIQRWVRDWGRSMDFKAPEAYRMNAIASVSTHDMLPLDAWWECEAGTVDEDFARKCFAGHGIALESHAGIFEKRRGRLFWNLKRVPDEKTLAEILGKPEKELRGILELYRSTHDEREKFWKFLGFSGAPDETASPKAGERALRRVCETASVFSIPSLQDWLALERVMGPPDPEKRINRPGIVDDKNWRLQSPVFIEEFSKFGCNRVMRNLVAETGRAE